jgi:hypothetical protein
MRVILRVTTDIATLGNPLKYTDPTGHAQQCSGCDGAGGVSEASIAEQNRRKQSIWLDKQTRPIVYAWERAKQAARQIGEITGLNELNPTLGVQIAAPQQFKIGGERCDRTTCSQTIVEIAAKGRNPNSLFTVNASVIPLSEGGVSLSGIQVEISSLKAVRRFPIVSSFVVPGKDFQGPSFEAAPGVQASPIVGIMLFERKASSFAGVQTDVMFYDDDNLEVSLVVAVKDVTYARQPPPGRRWRELPGVYLR